MVFSVQIKDFMCDGAHTNLFTPDTIQERSERAFIQCAAANWDAPTVSLSSPYPADYPTTASRRSWAAFVRHCGAFAKETDKAERPCDTNPFHSLYK
jgi:hypothetical protein